MGDDRLISPRIEDTEPSAGGQVGSPAKFSYREIFDRECGYYLHLGMSLEEYWDGDCDAVKWYRGKAEHDREQRNFELWLQGRYVYEALLAASPALKPFVKNPNPVPYCKEPYPITKRMQKQEEERDQMTQMEIGLAHFTALANKINENMEHKEGGEMTDGSGT